MKIRVEGRLSSYRIASELCFIVVERRFIHDFTKEKTRIQEGAARDLNPSTALHALYNEVYAIVLNASIDRPAQSMGCSLLLSDEEVRST